jgi:uracil-DNA glycosylase
MSNVNLKEIQQKLYEKLKPSGWAERMKAFLLSDDFHSILEDLLEQTHGGKRFTPVLKQLFRAFEECPFEELHTIIIGQSPHPKAGEADGILLSASNTGVANASLNKVFGELERTVTSSYVHNPDLKRWSNQGVLMLNPALTTEIGKVDTHIELWKPFMVYLFDVLNNSDTGRVYVFMGTKAKDWNHYISKNNFKFFVSNPAGATYRNTNWDSGDLFNSINKVLTQNRNIEITW